MLGYIVIGAVGATIGASVVSGNGHIGDAPVRYDFSRAHLIAQCERSLEQLGIETIDLLHLHRPDYLMDAAEVAGVFTELRASGKVREFAALLHSRRAWQLERNAEEKGAESPE